MFGHIFFWTEEVFSFFEVVASIKRKIFSFNSQQQISQKSAKENKLIYFLLFHDLSQIKIDTKEGKDEIRVFDKEWWHLNLSR